MPSDRLSLRLGKLPHDVLAELAARLCSDSPALQAAAEECMAAHTPLPHEMVERVLLSPDLVPHLLGPLEAEDGAAAAVCSQWLAGWKATNEPRRRLKQVPLDFDYASVHRSGVIAASDDSIFHAINYPPVLRRSSHYGTVDAEYQLEDHKFSCPVLAPGGLLFCVTFELDVDTGDVLGGQDEIIALDAQTLQLRHRFGRGLLNDVEQLVVGGDELYACDAGKHRLQVFSLTGEHRRSITGEWRSPHFLCCVKDRLYLVEREPDMEDREEDEDGEPVEPAFPLQGRRILVLSLQGDILQVVTHPTEPTAEFTSICCFDRKLLARYTYSIVESAGTHTRKYGMLALQGM